MKILITGCRGFLGANIGHFALQSGHEVLGIGRSSQPVDRWLGDFLQADVLHSDLSKAFESFSPDVVIHAAGTASVGASLDKPLDDLRAAVLTWANVLESIRRANIRPLILFPSSAAVYGNAIDLPISESAPIRPISPYGFHKALCELLAREYAECFGLNITICRIFSVFGEGQRRLLVWELFQQLMGDEPLIWLDGTGQESRDFLYIDDLASALLSIAAATPKHISGTHRIVNVATGQETNILALANQMRDIMAPEKKVVCRGKEQLGDPIRWRADISAFQHLVQDWRPRTLLDGLTRCSKIWRDEFSS